MKETMKMIMEVVGGIKEMLLALNNRKTFKHNHNEEEFFLSLQ